MARTVDREEYTAKRNEILDAAHRLVFTKGYTRMTIQDILATLGISSGAFYHYFDSKPALLAGYIERIREKTEEPLLPILHDPELPALAKLRGFFATLESLRVAHKADVIRLGRIWYTDDNALVRQKVEEAVREQRAPLLNTIVRQGIQEGVFTTAYPDQAGEVILALLQGMGNTHARLLFSPGPACDVPHRIECIVTTYAAYMAAIEQVLGAPPNSLARIDAEDAQAWVTALMVAPEQAGTGG